MRSGRFSAVRDVCIKHSGVSSMLARSQKEEQKEDHPSLISPPHCGMTLLHVVFRRYAWVETLA